MAVALGTNDLKIYRRHVAGCTRYPGLKKKPDTFKPNSKKEQMEDTCGCPIWCRGYLAKETDTVGDQIRPRRVFASLGCHNWTSAQKEVALLYERGCLSTAESGARPIDNSAVTVRHAASRYLESRTGASLNSVEKDTYAHYASLIEQRLLPYCEKQGIAYLSDFENTDVCSRFTESWRQLRRSKGAVLKMTTRKTELARFRTFLKFCVLNECRLCRMRHSRHTFAIQHLNQGTDIKLVSKWLGHKSVAITIAHYSNWIGTTKKLAEDVSREANARMMAAMDALPA